MTAMTASEPTAQDQLNGLVLRARRLGSDESLVVHGGGNTSSKLVEADHLGRRRTVLRVKASGSDLARVEPEDFPGLLLDHLLSLQARAEMTDGEMTAFLQHCLAAPTTRRPSIETLLHAFLPAPHVDHVHADAICALTNAPDAESLVCQALGDDVVLIPWMRPGFALAKRAGQAARSARAIVLAHHGLVTWGATGDESLHLTLELVRAAEAFLAGQGTGRPGTLQPDLPAHEAEDLLLALRGRLSRSERQILQLRAGSRQVSDRGDVDELAQAGPATADHVLRIGLRAAVVREAESVEPVLDEFEDGYRAYWSANRSRNPAATMRDPSPRVVVVPGLGVLAGGSDERSARVVADCAWHTLHVAATVKDAFGTVDRLSDADLFDIDYWPLELAKLSPVPRRDLHGMVVLVTGAASGIGRDTAVHLAGLGAHLAVADLDAAGLEATAEMIAASGGTPVVTAGDLTSSTVVDKLVSSTIRRFGGIDGAVSNVGIATTGTLETLSVQEWRRCLDVNATSHFLLTKRLLPVLRRQGIGGSLVYVVSKNALAPGAGFGAYSAAKAALLQLARIAAIEGGADGIRANIVNPDAVFHGSRLWSPELRASRAAEHGVAPEDLERFYAERNLLHRTVSGTDVAAAAAFLLSDRSSRTTGTIVAVDGGVAPAFPR